MTINKPKIIKTIDRGHIKEHICKCGVGHPIYASADWAAITSKESGVNRENNVFSIHGCCGCCQDKDWQITSLEKSVEIANDIIIEHKKIIKELRKTISGFKDDNK